MNKLHVLKIDFEFSDMIDSIYPVILKDDKEMVLTDCGYPNFLGLIEESVSKNNVDLVI